MLKVLFRVAVASSALIPVFVVAPVASARALPQPDAQAFEQAAGSASWDDGNPSTPVGVPAADTCKDRRSATTLETLQIQMVALEEELCLVRYGDCLALCANAQSSACNLALNNEQCQNGMSLFCIMSCTGYYTACDVASGVREIILNATNRDVCFPVAAPTCTTYCCDLGDGGCRCTGFKAAKAELPTGDDLGRLRRTATGALA